MRCRRAFALRYSLFAILCGAGYQPVVAQTTQPAVAAPALKPIPVSDRSLRIFVNVTTGAYTYSPQLFAAEPGMLGLHAVYQDAVDDASFIRAAVRMRTVNPAGLLGMAVSGDHVIKAADVQYWPPECLPFEGFPTAYLRTEYDAASRSALVKLEADVARLYWTRAIATHVLATEAALLAKEPRCKLDWLFLDNNKHPVADSRSPVTWAQTCDLFAGLKCRLNARGIRLLANVAGRPCDLPLADVRMLAASVDGVLCEQPLDFRTVSNREALEHELAVYEELLGAGKLVVLSPAVQVVPDTTGMSGAERQATILAARETRRLQLAALAALVRQPGQSIFIDSESWVAERACDRFPATLGPPTAPLQLTGAAGGSIRHTRRFTQGVLTLDAAAGTVRLDPPGE